MKKAIFISIVMFAVMFNNNCAICGDITISTYLDDISVYLSDFNDADNKIYPSEFAINAKVSCMYVYPHIDNFGSDSCQYDGWELNKPLLLSGAGTKLINNISTNCNYVVSTSRGSASTVFYFKPIGEHYHVYEITIDYHYNFMVHIDKFGIYELNQKTIFQKLSTSNVSIIDGFSEYGSANVSGHGGSINHYTILSEIDNIIILKSKPSVLAPGDYVIIADYHLQARDLTIPLPGTVYLLGSGLLGLLGLRRMRRR